MLNYSYSTGGKAQKRAEHNAIERARRESLNTKFQQLAHSLPNLQNDRRPSKGTIIERTLEYGKKKIIKISKYSIVMYNPLDFFFFVCSQTNCTKRRTLSN